MSLAVQQKLERLAASLQSLAIPLEEQVALFPGFVHIADELALLFEDCVRLAEQLPEFGRFTPSQRAMLREFDRRFERLSGTKDPSFWTTKDFSATTDGMTSAGEPRPHVARSRLEVERPGEHAQALQHLPFPKMASGSSLD